MAEAGEKTLDEILSSVKPNNKAEKLTLELLAESGNSELARIYAAIHEVYKGPKPDENNNGPNHSLAGNDEPENQPENEPENENQTNETETDILAQLPQANSNKEVDKWLHGQPEITTEKAPEQHVTLTLTPTDENLEETQSNVTEPFSSHCPASKTSETVTNEDQETQSNIVEPCSASKTTETLGNGNLETQSNVTQPTTSETVTNEVQMVEETSTKNSQDDQTPEENVEKTITGDSEKGTNKVSDKTSKERKRQSKPSLDSLVGSGFDNSSVAPIRRRKAGNDVHLPPLEPINQPPSETGSVNEQMEPEPKERNFWTQNEDEKLREGFRKYKHLHTTWAIIKSKYFGKTRTNVQIKDRARFLGLTKK